MKSKFLRKLLSVSLCAAVIGSFGLLAPAGIQGGVLTASAYESVSEVPEGYTAIRSIADLYSIRSNSSGNYILMNDIDLSETAQGGTWDSGNGWAVIPEFSGILDGNGYSIKNMSLYGALEYGGFISSLTGTVKNLSFENVAVDIYNTNYYGTVCSYGSNCTIENCAVSGTVSVEKIKSGYIVSVGGIAGSAREVLNCSFNGTLEATGDYVGGIVGEAEVSPVSLEIIEITINFCCVNGTITGTDGYLGGIVGYLRGKSRIYDSYNAADLALYGTTEKHYVGGLFGVICPSSTGNTSISDCYNVGTISSYGYNYKAGICGYLNGYNSEPSVTFSRCCDFSGNGIYKAINTGYDSYSFSSIYYLSPLVEGAGAVTGEAVTAEQLSDRANFNSLNFTDRGAWEMAPDGSRPQLKNPREIYVTDIEVTRMPPKTTYNVGESLIAVGEITVTCSNGNTATANLSEATLSGYDMNTPGEQTVNIDYKGGKGSFTITVVDPNHSTHTYEGVETTPATCTEDGVMTYTCSGCGDTYTEAIPKTGHDYEEEVVSPTCTAQGYTKHTCKNCGDTYNDTYTEKTDHEYTSETVNPATCTEDGLLRYTCEHCGDTYTEAIPKTGHDYEDEVVSPTCTAQGYTKHTCKNCGHSYEDTYTAKTEHSFDNGTVTVQPTYTATGLKVYTCTVCGAQRAEVIPMLELENLVNSSTIDKTKARADESFTVTANASGGTGGYTYRLLYRAETAKYWRTVQNYTAATEMQFTPPTDGAYQLCVYAKDSMGNIARKYFAVEVEAIAPLVNNSSISADTVAVGGTVTVNAEAAGGTGGYKYAVYYRPTNKSSWTNVQTYSANTTVSITPSTAGNYLVRVYAKDSKGTIKSLDLSFTAAALTNTSDFARDESEHIIHLGDSVTVNASSVGGQGTMQYALYQKLETAKYWSTAQAYTESTELTFTPKSAGVYSLKVYAKDGNGKISQKLLTLEVIS